MDHYIMMTTSVVYLYNMLIPKIHDFELWIKTNFQFMIVVAFSTVARKFRPERDSNRIPLRCRCSAKPDELLGQKTIRSYLR